MTPSRSARAFVETARHHAVRGRRSPSRSLEQTQKLNQGLTHRIFSHTKICLSRLHNPTPRVDPRARAPAPRPVGGATPAGRGQQRSVGGALRSGCLKACGVRPPRGSPSSRARPQASGVACGRRGGGSQGRAREHRGGRCPRARASASGGKERTLRTALDGGPGRDGRPSKLSAGAHVPAGGLPGETTVRPTARGSLSVTGAITLRRGAAERHDKDDARQPDDEGQEDQHAAGISRRQGRVRGLCRARLRVATPYPLQGVSDGPPRSRPTCDHACCPLFGAQSRGTTGGRSCDRCTEIVARSSTRGDALRLGLGRVGARAHLALG